MHELQEVHRDVRVPEGTAGEAQNCSDTPRTLAHSLSRTAVAGCFAGVWHGGRAALGLQSSTPEGKGDAKAT